MGEKRFLRKDSGGKSRGKTSGSPPLRFVANQECLTPANRPAHYAFFAPPLFFKDAQGVFTIRRQLVYLTSWRGWWFFCSIYRKFFLNDVDFFLRTKTMFFVSNTHYSRTNGKYFFHAYPNIFSYVISYIRHNIVA